MGKEKCEGEQASGTGSGKRVRGELSGMKENMEELEDFLSKREIVKLEIREDHEEIKGPFEAGLFTVKVLLNDLLKLENQIPFFIINTLFDLLRMPEDDDINLPRCVLDLFCNIQPSESKWFKTPSIDSFHHLLHLFHSSRTYISRQKAKESNTTTREWVARATELKQSGVEFRNKEATNFLDITFNKGRMEIPPLRVTDHTRFIFRNLIAFEQCYADAMTYVTACAVFMGCIINKAEDAWLLQLRDILVNKLSTEKALAGIFNKSCNQIYFSPDNNSLADLFAGTGIITPNLLV